MAALVHLHRKRTETFILDTVESILIFLSLCPINDINQLHLRLLRSSKTWYKPSNVQVKSWYTQNKFDLPTTDEKLHEARIEIIYSLILM